MAEPAIKREGACRTDRQSRTVVALVEDPGAANMLLGLAAELSVKSVALHIAAFPIAATHLKALGEPFAVATETPRALLEQHRPDLLVVGTSQMKKAAAHEAVLAAREIGIPTLGIVDMASNAEHRFRGHTDNPLAFAPEHIAVVDAETAAAFRELGLPQENMTVVRHPGLDHARMRGLRHAFGERTKLRQRLFPEVDPGLRWVCFVAEGLDHLDRSRSYLKPNATMFGRGKTRFRAAVALEETLDAVATCGETAQVILRLHPYSDGAELGALPSECAGVSLGGDPMELVAACDLIVGMTSMLLLEAVQIGKPVIAIISSPEERKWVGFLSTPGIEVVATRDELRRIIQSAPSVPPPSWQEVSPEPTLAQCIFDRLL